MRDDDGAWGRRGPTTWRGRRLAADAQDAQAVERRLLRRRTGREPAPAPRAEALARAADARRPAGALAQLQDLRETAARERREELRAGLGAAQGALEAAWRRLDAFDAAAEASLRRAAEVAAAAGRDPLVAARAQRRALKRARAALSATVLEAHQSADRAVARLRSGERAISAAAARTAALEIAAGALASPPPEPPARRTRWTADAAGEVAAARTRLRGLGSGSGHADPAPPRASSNGARGASRRPPPAPTSRRTPSR